MSKSAFYIVAGLAGLYIADVQLNQGRATDNLGLYNWNKNSIGYQAQEKLSSFQSNTGTGNIYNDGKNAIQDSLNKIPSGSDVKQKAADVYNDAYDRLIDAQKKVDDSVQSQFTWGQKDPKKDAQEHLENAKSHFAKAKDHLLGFGSNSVEEADKKAKRVGNVIYDKLGGVKDQFNQLTANIADKYNDLYDAAGNLMVTSEDKAKEVSRYYDDQFQESKKAYEDTQSSWLHWRNAKSQEIQDQAKANYEAAKSKNLKAKNELNKWIQQAKNNVRSKADDSYSSAKEAKEGVVSKAYDAKDYVKENANNAYSKVQEKAGDAKDNVDSAYYKAKDNADSAYGKAQENADYAYNYAAGKKDRVVQAGYDTKEDAKEGGQAALNYVAGAKNSVVQASENAAGFFKDKYENVRDGMGRLLITSEEKAKEVADYYDYQLRDAKKEYDDTQASWLHWRNAKSAEIQENAKRRYEYALKKDDEAKAELSKWIQNAKAGSIKKTEKGIDSAQENLNAAHDKAQDALDNARGWLKR